jgi:hypothetical protein
MFRGLQYLQDATISNSIDAVDGTTTTNGDDIFYSTDALSTAGTVQSTRIIGFNAGTSTVRIKAVIGTNTDTFTISGASIRVIPLYNF